MDGSHEISSWREADHSFIAHCRFVQTPSSVRLQTLLELSVARS